MKKKLIKLLGGYTAKEVQDIRAYYRGMLKAEVKKAKIRKEKGYEK